MNDETDVTPVIKQSLSSSKKPHIRNETYEACIVILLGITAILTGWAAYVSATYSRNQATSYTQSINMSADGNARWNQAVQELSRELSTWDTITELRIDYTNAENQNDQATMSTITRKINRIYSDNVTKEFQIAIDWADAQEDYASPFAMEGYIDSLFADAQKIIDEADELLLLGHENFKKRDMYLLVITVYTFTLLILCTSHSFKIYRYRLYLMVVAVIALLCATVYLLTLPIPPDLTFFK